MWLVLRDAMSTEPIPTLGEPPVIVVIVAPGGSRWRDTCLSHSAKILADSFSPRVSLSPLFFSFFFTTMYVRVLLSLSLSLSIFSFTTMYVRSWLRVQTNFIFVVARWWNVALFPKYQRKPREELLREKVDRAWW